MPVSINQLNVGMGLLIDGQIYLIVEHQHVKPGKGGAFARVKLRNVKTSQILDKTFKQADKFEVVDLEERKIQYLYKSGDTYHFMDSQSFEQIAISEDVVEEIEKFLQDNLEVTGIFYKNKILKVNLPIFIEAKITGTDPGLKGDSSKAGTKPATIDTGATIQVPLFINIGDFVKIDTRSGTYVERVKK